MAEQPSQDQIDRWHRYFAVECNNRAWDLASQEMRTPPEEREMLHAAYAAAFHWAKVGKPVNHARADVTLAHVLSVAGQGALALYYARRSLAFFESNPAEDWDLAFAHLEMALAAAVSNEAALHARHYALAQEKGAAVAEQGDRQVFSEMLAQVPRP